MHPSILSLVIATGCCLLWTATAQKQSDSIQAPSNTQSVDVTPPNPGSNTPSQGPSKIGIYPLIIEPGEQYTVTWDGCASSSGCMVVNAELVEIDVQTFSPFASQSIPYQSFMVTLCTQSAQTTPCAIATASEDLPTGASSYQIDVTWVTSNGFRSSTAVPASIFGVGQPSTYVGSTIVTPTTNPVTAITNALPTATSGIAVSDTTGNSSSLSTGAKVGIAVGAVGIALIILIAALLLWRRSRQKLHRALPNVMPYSHDTVSTNHDLTPEKETNVISSPVDTLHNGYSSMPPGIQTQSRSQTGSWAQPEEHTATSAAVTAAPHANAERRSFGSGYEDSASPIQDSQPHMPPLAAGAVIQRKPVGSLSGPTHHLREPGMSNEEVARLEEEERRLDEAIAEAERRRQLQG